MLQIVGFALGCGALSDPAAEGALGKGEGAIVSLEVDKKTTLAVGSRAQVRIDIPQAPGPWIIWHRVEIFDRRDVALVDNYGVRYTRDHVTIGAVSRAADVGVFSDPQPTEAAACQAAGGVDQTLFDVVGAGGPVKIRIDAKAFVCNAVTYNSEPLCRTFLDVIKKKQLVDLADWVDLKRRYIEGTFCDPQSAAVCDNVCSMIFGAADQHIWYRYESQQSTGCGLAELPVASFDFDFCLHQCRGYHDVRGCIAEARLTGCETERFKHCLRLTAPPP